MNLENLSDGQLIKLFKNKNLDKELKSKIIFEIDRRDLEIISSVEKELSLSEKIKIVLTGCFLYKYHVKTASKFLIIGNKKTYKQYWKYFNLGLFIYIFIFLLVVKYILKPLY
ncbi:MAG: hypothetical protein HC854_04570 [Flavobacterium sp.]|nr:hypothetical protein [Flavobacterium sp.]